MTHSSNQLSIPHDSSLAQGNRSLRGGANAIAVAYYLRALLATPGLSNSIADNLAMARKRYRVGRTAKARRSVAVCGWELSHNAAERVVTLTKLYENFADVEVIGCHFPDWGRDVWEPLQARHIAKHSFIVEDENKFMDQAILLVAEHPYDIVHLSNPRAPNILIGMLYKLVWDAKVLMDIDDEQLALVDAAAPLNSRDHIEENEQLFKLHDLVGPFWSRLAVNLAKEFDGITVSKPALQARFGGSIVPEPLCEFRWQTNLHHQAKALDGQLLYIAQHLGIPILDAITTVGSRQANQLSRQYPKPHSKKIDKRSISSTAAFERRRVAIFASYSADGRIEDYVLFYLKNLKSVAEYIVFVSDNFLPEFELSKLKGIVDVSFAERHGEYDFGSYKKGFFYLKKFGLLDNYDELILCNDSCYGPVSSFVPIFTEMASRDLDFWGLTQNSQFKKHLQSYFLVFKSNVARTKDFETFMANVKKEENVQGVILNYEINFTILLEHSGFIWDSFIKVDDSKTKKKLEINSNLTVFPVFLAESDCQLIKVKAMKRANCNYDGIFNTSQFIHMRNKGLYDCIDSHIDLRRYSNPALHFSIIIPATECMHLAKELTKHFKSINGISRNLILIT